MKFSKCKTSLVSRKHVIDQKSQTLIDNYFNIVGNKKKQNIKSSHRSKPILVLDLDETLVHCTDTFTYGVDHKVKVLYSLLIIYLQ